VFEHVVLKKLPIYFSVSFKLFLSLNSEEDEQRRRQEKLRKEEDLQEFFIFLYTTTTFETFFLKMIWSYYIKNGGLRCNLPKI
jgi:hypothetical protein